MRLVRFPARPTQVSDDVRAALASLGRGHTTVGGIALLGVRPPGVIRAVDAVLVLPHAVLVVVGVDLPHPAMRLEAPLSQPWKVDGWPLVGAGEVVNPAVDALALADSVTALVREAEPRAALGTVVAVGPFVEHVEQPPAELAGTVRVVHPTSTSMLAAAMSVVARTEVLTTAQARAVLHALAPDAADQDDATLIAEGFGTSPPPPADASGTPPVTSVPGIPAVTSVATPATAPASVRITPRPPRRRARYTPRPGHHPRPAAARRTTVVAGALGAVVALVAVTIAAMSDAEPSAAVPPREPVVLVADGLRFTEHASRSDTECAAHAVGDLQVFLAEPGCTTLRRASYTTVVDGRDVAVSVAAVTFADEERATAFHALADTPGSGVLVDAATESRSWPGPAPAFANAAYAGSQDGDTVRIVLACSTAGPSTPDDPALATAATAALAIRLGDGPHVTGRTPPTAATTPR